MTPTEKDAMALAVLDRTDECLRDEMFSPYHPARVELNEARAHLASRIAEDADEIFRLNTRLIEETNRTDRAEAELAAVRANAERYLHLREANNADPTPFIAQRYEHGIMQWTGEEADAAVDAARGGE